MEPLKVFDIFLLATRLPRRNFPSPQITTGAPYTIIFSIPLTMEFNFRGWDAQMQHMYHTPVKEGLWSGTSLDGGQGVRGIYPGSMDSREAIQRELEKEKIREEILAEEIARKLVLEAEVRREMAMH
ncbi:hypothetical protein L6452_21995 [Arctium lappa]|uniref:Uncharacterized protein n=1 Tax=Arctium lappa TaxID=4217 RepID=A0ACB9B2W4_ARCLA|nr:hypothetical protein L6452_21995 [Arctium lappa]